MNLKYIFGAIISIPLLPIMYFQGRKIRSSVPKLPEAKGEEGVSSNNSANKLTVLTIGESTIAGVGVETHDEGFSGTLADELANKLKASINWKVYARSGYTARLIKKKLISQITESRVHLLVIGLGANDTFELNTPGKWERDIKELVKELRIKFPYTPIIFTNMPPIKNFPAFTPLIKFTLGNLVEILGNQLKKVVAELDNVYYYSRKITLEDWTERLKIEIKPEEFFSDGIHPSKLTYQVWAKDIANYIITNKNILSNILKLN